MDILCAIETQAGVLNCWYRVEDVEKAIKATPYSLGDNFEKLARYVCRIVRRWDLLCDGSEQVVALNLPAMRRARVNSTILLLVAYHVTQAAALALQSRKPATKPAKKSSQRGPRSSSSSVAPGTSALVIGGLMLVGQVVTVEYARLREGRCTGGAFATVRTSRGGRYEIPTEFLSLSVPSESSPHSPVPNT